ncbi:Glutaredoxin domain-containing cysteine-rich protein 1 [Homalodisca vitripennis]|nr:Glutaredoxin domain-containing cysteine-rich protein 1 [Homalodisca vitripennis]
MESPPPLPAKTRRSSHVPVIVSATRHSRPQQQSQQQHVVKIRVNPVEPVQVPVPATVPQSGANTVRINISSDYIQGEEMRGGSPYYFYTSGQSSPSDTLDSGTCSDLDGSTPPPLPKKTAVTVTVNRVNHQRGGSLTSSGAEVESDDEISCDSLNSSELDGSTEGKQEEAAIEPVIQGDSRIFQTTEPVVEDITERTSEVSLTETGEKHKILTKKVSNESNTSRNSVVEERTYEDRKKIPDAPILDPDSYYKFHLNENRFEPEVPSARQDDEDLFAGCKGYQEGDPAAATIRSSRGTIRGVKNRVRAGIATFLQMHSTKLSGAINVNCRAPVPSAATWRPVQRLITITVNRNRHYADSRKSAYETDQLELEASQASFTFWPGLGDSFAIKSHPSSTNTCSTRNRTACEPVLALAQPSVFAIPSNVTRHLWFSEKMMQTANHTRNRRWYEIGNNNNDTYGTKWYCT